MKNMKKLSVVFLPVVMGIAMLAYVLLGAFAPLAVLPKLNIPNTVLLSLVALLVGYYVKKDGGVNILLVLLIAALTFGVLPFAAGYATTLTESLKLALVGGVTYTVVAYLFDRMTDWLSSGSAGKIAPIISAFGLYLASQCFAGMVL